MQPRNRIVLAAACAGALAVFAAPALAAGDPAFLKKAMEGDNSEIRLGQLAAQKGGSAQVRDFGQTLNTDHTKSKAQVLPVAQAHGVAPTDQMTPAAQAEETKLQGLSGQAFDREFARYMVKDHKQDIADFERQSHQGDAATAHLARETLPTLRKHLAIAQGLASR